MSHKVYDLIHGNEVILDVGAGSGYLSLKIAKKLKNGKVICIDLSEEMLHQLEKRANKKQFSCDNQLFDIIDESKFRKELDIEKCKQLILWANVGFTNQLLVDIRNAETNALNYEIIVKKLDEYFDELRKVFYTSSNE